MASPKDDKAPQNPNDRFFRGYLGTRQNTRSLLRWKLPPELQKPLNWNTMRIKSTTFVDERLRLRESDLLVEFRTKGDQPVLVYILWEHQTKVDPMMAWRILCYRVEIWKSWLQDNPKATNFPFIHAMILYQGKKAWNAGIDFEELINFQNIELERSLDSQKVSSQYGVVSVMDMPKSGWPNDLPLRLGLSLMRAVTLKTQSDWLIEHGSDLNEILRKPRGNAIFGMVIEYIFISEGDEKKVLRALKQTPPKIEKQAMSVAEQLEERGEKRGEKRGLEKGREQKEVELISAMLRNGATPEEIVKLTGLKLSLVKKIEMELQSS